MRGRHYLTFVTATVVLVGGLAWWRESGAVPAGSAPVSVHTPTSVVEVAVAGITVGYAVSEAEVNQAVTGVLADIPGELRGEVNPSALISSAVVPARSGINALAGGELRQLLASKLPRFQRGWMVTVNGNEIVALASQEEAQAVVTSVQEDYRRTFLQEAVRVETVRFLESIGFREKWTLSDKVRGVADATAILRFGTDKRVFHTVQRGDTLWDIATAAGLAAADLQKANPDIDPEGLQPGQQVSMTIKEPIVHLESVETQIYEESIPFAEDVGEDPELWPWEVRVLAAGRPGVRRVTVRVQRQDGKETGREVVETEVLSRPSRQTAVRGTRLAPPKGTGQFHWPVQGEISSMFGARWGGWHQGVDIAAPTGTPIYAADSGTVVYADWQGNYGLNVQIDHGGGRLVTLYGHMSQVGVGLGQSVSKGDIIGYVGSTGYSTGPHLHFEVRIEGRAVNPFRFYP